MLSKPSSSRLRVGNELTSTPLVIGMGLIEGQQVQVPGSDSSVGEFVGLIRFVRITGGVGWISTFRPTLDIPS